MADKPILFSAPMVLALLSGTKTQTRRALPTAHPKFPNHNQINMDVLIFDPSAPEAWYWDGIYDRVGASYALRIAVGDRLYVREAWRATRHIDDKAPRNMVKTEAVQFVADGAIERGFPQFEVGKHRQAMHMPRWASRLTLTVTDVRVQRLQDISEADAMAEGCIIDGNLPAEIPHKSGIGEIGWDCARDWYADLWDEINGPGAWDQNPWVAAYSFTVQHGNIDQVRL